MEIILLILAITVIGYVIFRATYADHDDVVQNKQVYDELLPRGCSPLNDNNPYCYKTIDSSITPQSSSTDNALLGILVGGSLFGAPIDDAINNSIEDNNDSIEDNNNSSDSSCDSSSSDSSFDSGSSDSGSF